MRRVKDSPNYDNIVKSLDFRFGRRQTLVFISYFVVFMLYSRFRYSPGSMELRIYWIVCSVFLGPAIIWSLIRWLGIFIRLDSYVFFKTRLDQPNLGFKYGIYYTVHGMDAQGRFIQANTRRMFSNLLPPTFEEYNNLPVLAGYNQRTGRVIIVRKAIYD